MRRRGKTGRKAIKAQRHRALTRRNAPKVARRRNSSVASQETEVERLTRELEEAREQQTATSEVLNIIRRSPADAQPVFDTIVQSAARLCGAIFSVVYLCDDDHIRIAAVNNFTPEATLQIHELQELKRPHRSHLGGRAILERAIVHVPDVLADAEYSRELALAGGWRAVLAVPLLRDGIPVGAITVAKTEPVPFSDRQILLLKTFADQALIAIENVRLFETEQQQRRELSESLEQQTATSEVLKVISSSSGELEPVFKAILENATRICQARFGALHLYDGDVFRRVALHNPPPQFATRQGEVISPHPKSGLGTVARTKQIAYIDDVLTSQPYLEGNQHVVEFADRTGARTAIAVPMLKEDELIGAIAIFRQEIRPFTDKQIELVKSFAAQAVIATENTRLLKELRQRTADLTLSLEELRTAQDRLVQTEKLASLGQLTAGIAHEIKNPLNFVNNFSGMSAELIGELQDTLGGISIDLEAHAQIKGLTDTLRGNLEKIVQHGKRADAIVKSMLLHSGQSSGEHRSTDINALVEESLNRAYYNARAEKRGFTIKLERSFDPEAGEVDLFPREITRALLNLISNGFYAATKRKAEAKQGDHEPILAASTKNLGDRVEITIRDNGTGIPADVKEKIFNPFFTTKPTGEGTGLGLSISHDIIVKQHGGSIDVDTQTDQFTEFRVVLPRTGATSAKSGRQA